eukprot:PhM_4_TR2060/c0_g1_i13/m.99961
MWRSYSDNADTQFPSTAATRVTALTHSQASSASDAASRCIAYIHSSSDAHALRSPTSSCTSTQGPPPHRFSIFCSQSSGRRQPPSTNASNARTRKRCDTPSTTLSSHTFTPTGTATPYSMCSRRRIHARAAQTTSQHGTASPHGCSTESMWRTPHRENTALPLVIAPTHHDASERHSCRNIAALTSCCVACRAVFHDTTMWLPKHWCTTATERSACRYNLSTKLEAATHESTSLLVAKNGACSRPSVMRRRRVVTCCDGDADGTAFMERSFVGICGAATGPISSDMSTTDTMPNDALSDRGDFTLRKEDDTLEPDMIALARSGCFTKMEASREPFTESPCDRLTVASFSSPLSLSSSSASPSSSDVDTFISK